MHCARNDRSLRSLMITSKSLSNTSEALMLTDLCTALNVLGFALSLYTGAELVRVKQELYTIISLLRRSSTLTQEDNGLMGTTDTRSSSSTTTAGRSSSSRTYSSSLIGIRCECQSRVGLYLGRLRKSILRLIRILVLGIRMRIRNT